MDCHVRRSKSDEQRARVSTDESVVRRSRLYDASTVESAPVVLLSISPFERRDDHLECVTYRIIVDWIGLQSYRCGQSGRQTNMEFSEQSQKVVMRTGRGKIE